VRAAEKIGTERRAKAKTKTDAEAYVKDVREKVATCFGKSPEKAPLNAKVTGKLERDAYTIEKVIFESRPQFFVTANLYLPKGAKGPRPGVVGSCGHSHGERSEPAYQSFCQGLARIGDIVLSARPTWMGSAIVWRRGAAQFGRGRPFVSGASQTSPNPIR
jgi:hypothetical protein